MFALLTFLLQVALQYPGVGVDCHLGHGVGTARPAAGLWLLMELRAGSRVGQHHLVQLLLREVGVSQPLFDVRAGDEMEVSEVAGQVHNPGRVWQHREEGIADVLESPVVDVHRPLDLAVMLSGVVGRVEVHGGVIDEDVDLTVLVEDEVP